MKTRSSSTKRSRLVQGWNRQEEMGLLLRAWDGSCRGRGQVVLIQGEAGVGKSRLVEGLREATAKDHIWVAIRWMSVPVPEDRYPHLSMTAQQQRDATFDAIVAWLIEVAERTPVLMAWEDLHWADPTTLETLGMLIEQAPTAAMLVVATFRPELTPPWPQRSHMTPITLNRLERPEVETMVGHLAGGRPLPGEVVEHIVAKSDGVPLYVEGLTKAILGSGVLVAQYREYALCENGWALGASGESEKGWPKLHKGWTVTVLG